MNKIKINKMDDSDDDSDDSDDSEILCNCNLCWTTRQIFILLNNLLFKNPFVLFTIISFLSIVFIKVIL